MSSQLLDTAGPEYKRSELEHKAYFRQEDLLLTHRQVSSKAYLPYQICFIQRDFEEDSEEGLIDMKEFAEQNRKNLIKYSRKIDQIPEIKE